VGGRREPQSKMSILSSLGKDTTTTQMNPVNGFEIPANKMIVQKS